MLTATLADLFYNAALLVKKQGGITNEQAEAWQLVFPTIVQAAKNGNDAVVQIFANAGDSVMERIYSHVKDDGFHISEQIDKNNGAQISAENLTWSYANILTALKRREELLGKQCDWVDLFKLNLSECFESVKRIFE